MFGAKELEPRESLGRGSLLAQAGILLGLEAWPGTEVWGPGEGCWGLCASELRGAQPTVALTARFSVGPGQDNFAILDSL